MSDWQNEQLAWLVRSVTGKLPVFRGMGKITARAVNLFPAETRTLRTIEFSDDLRLTVDVSQKYERSMFYSPQLYEWRSIDLLRRHLKPGNTFVDIGTNIGLFTLQAA